MIDYGLKRKKNIPKYHLNKEYYINYPTKSYNLLFTAHEEYHILK